MESLEKTIRDHAWAYVERRATRDDFMDWFGPVLMDDVDKANEMPTLDLAGDIARLDAEFTSGAWSEDQLREAIRQRLHRYVAVVVPRTEPAPVASSGNVVSTPVGMSPIASAR